MVKLADAPITPAETHVHNHSIPAGIVEQATIAATTAVATPTTEKKLSPKNKKSRNVPDDWKSTWLAYDAPPEENERLHKIATQRKVKVADLLLMVLKHGMQAYAEQFEVDVKAYDATPHAAKATVTTKDVTAMAPEEAEAYVNKRAKAAATALERAQAQLAAHRQRMANIQAAATA